MAMSLLPQVILSVHSLISVFPRPIADAIFVASQRLFLLYLSLISALLLLPFLFICRYLPQLKYGDEYEAHRRQCQAEPDFRRRTILITGVNSIKGLALARSFYLCGHSVIGADFECYWRFSPARFSRALVKFHQLPIYLRFGDVEAVVSEYADEITDIIDTDSVDLWINCSGSERVIFLDSHAKQFVEERTRCSCVQFDYTTTARILSRPHNFFDLVEMEGGISPLETHRVTSKTALHCIQQIRGWSGRDLSQKFILGPGKGAMMLNLLHTADFIGPCYLSEILEQSERLDICRSRPWILEQHICGRYYRSHALIVRGQIAIFFVCPIQPESVSRLGATWSRRPGFYHRALDPGDWLSEAMREFTEAFIKMISSSHDPVTGHLSFDFVLDVSRSQLSRDNLYVLSCGTGVRTAMALFIPAAIEWSQAKKMRAMVEAYLSILTTKDEAEEKLTSSWGSIRSAFNAPRYPGPGQTSPSKMTPDLQHSAFANRETKWHQSRHDRPDYCYEFGDGFPAVAGPSQPIPPGEEDDVTSYSNLPTPPSTPPTLAQTAADESTATGPCLLNPKILSPLSENDKGHRYLASHHLIARILAPLTKLTTGQITSRVFWDSVNRFITDTGQWKELAFEVWDPVPFFLIFAYSLADGWWSHFFGLKFKR